MGKSQVLKMFFLILMFINLVSAWSMDGEKVIGLKGGYSVKEENLQLRYHDTRSVLSWKEIKLRGFEGSFYYNHGLLSGNNLIIDFSGGYFESYRCYFVDDDVFAKSEVIGAGTGEAVMVEGLFRIMLEGKYSGFYAGFGIKNTLIEINGCKGWGRGAWDYPDFYDWSSCTYKMFFLNTTLGICGKFDKGIFYVKYVSGVGVGYYSGKANWFNNGYFRSGVSFWDRGMFFRGEVDFEAGVRLGRVRLFGRGNFNLYRNAGIGITTQYKWDGKEAKQQNTMNGSVELWTVGTGINF